MTSKQIVTLLKSMCTDVYVYSRNNYLFCFSKRTLLHENLSALHQDDLNPVTSRLDVKTHRTETSSEYTIPNEALLN